MRITNRAKRKRVIDNDLYPMGIIIPDRAIRKCVIVSHLYTGVTGKIIWDGYTPAQRANSTGMGIYDDTQNNAQ